MIRRAGPAAALLTAATTFPTASAAGFDGIQVRQREGWYRTAVLGGWRPIAG